MFKRIGVLAMILAGSMAVLTPSVAQARDWDDHGHSDRRVERRDFDRDRRERGFREHERTEWRERERFERRDFRGGYEYRPYNEYRYVAPYCPRY